MYDIQPTNRVIINRFKCPDGTILHSKYRHDYVVHDDSTTGERYFVDGGMEYCRRSVGLEDMCLYDCEEDHAEVRKVFTWTSRGTTGQGPTVQKALMDLTSDHIEAILLTQDQLNNYPQLVNMFKREINFRGNYQSKGE